MIGSPAMTSVRLALLIAPLMFAGAAYAEPPAKLDAAAIQRAIDAAHSSDAHAYVKADVSGADPLRTAVQSRSGGITGSMGYLCGIDDYPHGPGETRGPATSYGRESTFLGAKLSLAFR
jgi:hypothetical protein